MARQLDVKSIVEKFAAEIEAAVAARVNAEFASRFDELRGRILGGASTSAPKAAASSAPQKRRPGPRAGFKAALKPCPVCGTPNKARRFSYLCDEHRTEENKKKFKGGAAVTKKASAPRAAKKSRKAAPRSKADAAATEAKA